MPSANLTNSATDGPHPLPLPGQCTLLLTQWRNASNASPTSRATVLAALLQNPLGLTLKLLCALVQDLPDWQEILTYFRGSELQNYFTRILEDDLKAIIKPQYVDHIPKVTWNCP